MTESKPKTSVVMLNAPSKELIRTYTPFVMIREGAGEHYMPGFNAMFACLMFQRLNRETEGAFVDIFTADPFRIPKDEVLKMMRGCASDQAVYSLQITKRNGLDDPLVSFQADVLYAMAKKRWKEAALFVHTLFFWTRLGEVISTDEQGLTLEQRKMYDHVTVTAVELAERLFDNPHKAFELKIKNPQYLIPG